MNDMATKKDTMSSFLSALSDSRRTMESTDRLRHTRTYRWNCIKEKENEGKRNVAKEVFLTIYRGALPLHSDYKSLYQGALDNKILSHVTKSGSPDVYDFLYTAGQKGSRSAAAICRKADQYIAETCARYYEAGDDFDPDKIDMGPESTAVGGIVQRITKEMDAEEVSTMIEDNVKQTIAREMVITKQEDEKIKALEQELAGDDTVMNEEAVEMAIYQAGLRPNTIYQPTLFNGIMIGEVTKLSGDTSMTGEQKQKKAFYESVQELTALQTLQTLDIIDINVRNIDRIANEYAMVAG